MSINNRRWLRRFAAARLIGLSAALGALGGVTALAALSDAAHVVTQKDRAFQPRELSLHQGEAITFFNNDGDLLHHAYLDAADFSFDTGDQEPGSKADVAFTKKGTFTVLCGIHPKMKLTVRVE